MTHVIGMSGDRPPSKSMVHTAVINAAAGLWIAVGLPQLACADGPVLPLILSVPIEVSVLLPPTVFRADGRRHLAYEVRLTNWSSTAWTLRHIEVRSESGAELLSVGQDGVGGLLRFLGRKPADKSDAPDQLAPGASAVAYLWIDISESAPVPAAIQQQFEVQREGEASRQLAAPSMPVSNDGRAIGFPLRGDGWLAVNGPSNTSRHRRSTLLLDAGPHNSQRFAIDWIQVGADLASYHGDPKDNRNYWCYGADVLAVSDGVVVEIKDGIMQNVPNQPPAVPVTLETVAGNHIDLDLGRGVYAMYAHLQPGSLRVKLGDKVKRGQVIALVGNTGNSTEPHLHFQLMNRNSPLSSEGLPYTLPDYTITKRVIGNFEDAPITASTLPAPEIHHGEIPLEMQLVNFD